MDESLGVKPFREFNVPIFARVDKSIDSFVRVGEMRSRSVEEWKIRHLE
jgi:hypothetical protein